MRYVTHTFGKLSLCHIAPAEGLVSRQLRRATQGAGKYLIAGLALGLESYFPPICLTYDDGGGGEERV